MSNLTSMGSISLTNKQLDAFKNFLEGLGIFSYSIQFSSGMKIGENCAGLIIQATVKWNGNEAHFVLKRAPNERIFRTLIPVHEVFEREAYVYRTVFPEFLKLQKESQILNPFKSYPCLYSYVDGYYQEMLVFENVKVSGFKLLPRHRPLDKNHVLLVLKQYARLHALTLALRERRPEVFKQISKSMGDGFFERYTREAVRRLGEHRVKQALQTLDPIKDKSAYCKLHNFSRTMFQKLTALMEMENPYSVVSHIDCGIGNMLFKYDVNFSDEERPMEVCLIDFQMSRLASPAVDLACFLFSATDKTLRKDYDEFILEYHRSLCTFLNMLGSDGEKLLPMSVLQEQLKQHAIVGLYMAFLLLYVQSTVSQQIPDIFFDTSHANGYSFLYDIEDRSVYNTRVRDSILDFNRYGYTFP
ncbi:uncharacterized protein LOC116177409 isoform X2 [Photinus pyralis]|uniref:uncharacterized protein LOC116177409 isoform X2 n=1 Tax=Photinus pyralis TaxID=7054 RepID=UPI001267311A|nr:uncharacterized protein LOC116177409 isoform X2 [Photinus pyralis]